MTDLFYVRLASGGGVLATRTTDHAASSYGQPVYVTTDGDALDAWQIAEVRRLPVHFKCAPGQTVFDRLREAGIPYSRVGGWHEQPRAGEVLIATVRVHPHDPDIPVFF